MLSGIIALILLVCLAGVVYPFKPFGKRWHALVAALAAFVAIAGTAPQGGKRASNMPQASNEGELPKLVSAQATTTDCPAGSEPSGATLRVRGSDINVRTGPGTEYDRVVNHKATGIIGSTQYASIDSSTRVLEECRQGEWSRIRVVEPEWLRDTHRGWVANRFLLSDQEFTQTGFTEADIFFDDQTWPYKDLIVQAVNKIAREDPRCKDSLDLGLVTMSPSKSKPGKPVFFVTCGIGVKAVNVYFSEEDLSEGKTFKAPVHIDKATAVRLCEDYAKSAANFPSTVDFSTFWDLAVTEHPNGNTTVLSSFRAKNAFGLELDHKIRCLLNAGGLIEANIFEKS
jgi:hypothetical protein